MERNAPLCIDSIFGPCSHRHSFSLENVARLHDEAFGAEGQYPHCLSAKILNVNKIGAMQKY